MPSSRFAALSLLFILVGLTNASPLLEDAALTHRSLACLQPALTIDPSTWTSKADISRKLPNPLGKLPVFWSGRVGAGSILPYAEACAEKLKGATVGMLMCEIGGFVMPDNGSPPVPSRDLWNYASKAFADHTKGIADVVMGDAVDPQGTWVTVELPALKANVLVDAAIEIDRTTCAPKCYWDCRKPAACTGLKQCPPLLTATDNVEPVEEISYLAQIAELVPLLVY